MLPMSSLGDAVPVPPSHVDGASFSFEPVEKLEVSALPIGSVIVGLVRRPLPLAPLAQSSPAGLIVPEKRSPSTSKPPSSLLPVAFAPRALEAVAKVKYCKSSESTKSVVQDKARPRLARALMIRQIPRDAISDPPDPRDQCHDKNEPSDESCRPKLDRLSVNGPLGPVLLVPLLDNSPRRGRRIVRPADRKRYWHGLRISSPNRNYVHRLT